MKKVTRALARFGAEIVIIAGAAAIATGVGMIYLPAGLIAGGMLAICGAVLHIMGGGEGA